MDFLLIRLSLRDFSLHRCARKLEKARRRLGLGNLSPLNSRFTIQKKFNSRRPLFFSALLHLEHGLIYKWQPSPPDPNVSSPASSPSNHRSSRSHRSPRSPRSARSQQAHGEISAEREDLSIFSPLYLSSFSLAGLINTVLAFFDIYGERKWSRLQARPKIRWEDICVRNLSIEINSPQDSNVQSTLVHHISGFEYEVGHSFLKDITEKPLRSTPPYFLDNPFAYSECFYQKGHLTWIYHGDDTPELGPAVVVVEPEQNTTLRRALLFTKKVPIMRMYLTDFRELWRPLFLLSPCASLCVT